VFFFGFGLSFGGQRLPVLTYAFNLYPWTRMAGRGRGGKIVGWRKEKKRRGVGGWGLGGEEGKKNIGVEERAET
jgi:hypothetical protein